MSRILADNRLLDGVPTAQYTASGYDALNLRDLRTYTHWKSSQATVQNITVDCGTSHAADHIGIVKHNLSSIRAKVAVESSDNGFAWVLRCVLFSPASDGPVLVPFTTAGARFWRVILAGPEPFVPMDAPPSIAVLLLGQTVDFPRRPDAPFAPIEVTGEWEKIKSKTGQIIGRVNRYRSVACNPEWTNIEADFIDDKLRPLYQDHASKGNPFLWAWDLNDHPNDVYFMALKEGTAFNPTKTTSGFYDRASFPMEGILD